MTVASWDERRKNSTSSQHHNITSILVMFYLKIYNYTIRVWNLFFSSGVIVSKQVVKQ